MLRRHTLGVPTSMRAAVTVTFLRMERSPSEPALPLPHDTDLVRLSRPSVAFYRFLYDTVGAAHLWWLRRAMPESAVAGILDDPAVSVHVLYRGGEPCGFYELDGRARPDVNLSYFGLMPRSIGHGLGPALLRAAVDEAFCFSGRGVTVNTCTADHPRALPTYLRAGFKIVRSVREVWDVPARLGMTVPDHLRI